MLGKRLRLDDDDESEEGQDDALVHKRQKTNDRIDRRIVDPRSARGRQWFADIGLHTEPDADLQRAMFIVSPWYHNLWADHERYQTEAVHHRVDELIFQLYVRHGVTEMHDVELYMDNICALMRGVRYDVRGKHAPVAYSFRERCRCYAGGDAWMYCMLFADQLCKGVQATVAGVLFTSVGLPRDLGMLAGAYLVFHPECVTESICVSSCTHPHVPRPPPFCP